MSEYICWLVTVLYGDTLLRCALKVKRDTIPDACILYPMEHESRRLIHDMLPPHVKSCGNIVDIEELFDVHIVESRGE